MFDSPALVFRNVFQFHDAHLRVGGGPKGMPEELPICAPLPPVAPDGRVARTARNGGRPEGQELTI